MIEDLKRNLEQEKNILDEIEVLTYQMKTVAISERGMYISSINALKKQLKMLENTIPLLLESISIGPTEINSQISKIDYNNSSKTNQKQIVTINKSDKEKYTKELNMSSSNIENIKNTEERTNKINSLKPSLIAKISNTFFLGLSEKLNLSFPDLNEDLRDANIRITPTTYISISLFISLMLFLISGAGIGYLCYINPTSLIKWIWGPFVIILVSLFIFYLYPSTQKSAVSKTISNELPFLTIYMSAIANSKVESIQLFKIIAENEEYPCISMEMRKIINLIEIYGLDLVTALRNVAKKSTNPRLSELFNGLATNIVSGGSLKDYLGKKAENFLIDYKLERERYSSLAETFMDMYISILIAAPLILVLLLIIMNATKMTIGLPFTTLIILTLGGVVLVNFIFMLVIHIKQPTS